MVLGVDVGSVSTNLALVDDTGHLKAAVYIKTGGRPLDALKHALSTLTGTVSGPLNIIGVGTTGSGRHLAGHFLGADIIKNEIAAQLRAASDFLPDVDTVFEIGGQDAKYIRAEAGALIDFTMNRICAAGTGSFLEEQAAILGIDIIGEFQTRALCATRPVDLGRRCTVFMESEMVGAMAQGATVDDVAAGLSLSVARNYLDRVVGSAPIGNRIVFQGGTAANLAVVAAFEQILKREIVVHPHHRVSGALGIALMLQDARRSGTVSGSSRFRGINACNGELERSFECAKCSARCHVTRFRSQGEVFHFGDICERYSARDDVHARVTDPLAKRTALLFEASGIASAVEAPDTGAVGLLRASHSFSLLPWLTAIVRATGQTPYITPETDARILAKGTATLTADTCLPFKAALGHAAKLKETGVRRILVPAVAGLPGEEDLSASCIFGHHLPWLIAAHFEPDAVMAPELSFDMPSRCRIEAPDVTAHQLGLSHGQLKKALREGDRANETFRASLEAWGEEILKSDADRIALIMGRPYMLSDPFLNMGIGRHLARLGLPVLPMDALPLGTIPLDVTWQDLPWRFTRDLIRAAHLAMQDPRIFPVVISSFACGPDAFATKHLESLMKGRPHLMMELDEHRSEAGLLTRLEAFVDEVDTHIRRNKAPRPRQRSVPLKPTREARLIMPHFADHVIGHAGIMRAAGFEVVVLPPPDDSIRERGEALSSGRECHPFAMIAGDLVNWMESGDAHPDDVFFYPGTVVSCLLRQYGDGLNAMLERLNVAPIRIVTPSLDSWAKLVGLSLTIRMQAAQVAGDVMLRALCRIRPYEDTKGETDEVYRECLALVSSAAENGTLFGTLQQCAERFAAIRRSGAPRPVVGVAGDLYTRINGFASDRLLDRLEAAGLEVWPAPFGTDVAELNATVRRQRSVRLLRPKSALRYTMARRVMTKQRLRIDHIFSVVDDMRPEPSIPEIQAMVAPYMGRAANPLILLNIGRMIMYADGGVSGILNAACINCMVGAASEAFQERIKRDLDGVPITSLVYGGGSNSVNRARLDAFVHQVAQYHRRTQENR